MIKTILIQEQINEIVNLYNQKISCIDIANKTGIYVRLVSKTLKNNNVKVISGGYHSRKHKVAEDFFDQINTEEKAYFLGFLYADGNTGKNGKGFTIALQEKDKSILEKFSFMIYNKMHLQYRKLRIPTENDIKNYGFVEGKKRQGQYVLGVSSVRLNKQLRLLGCVPAKSLILEFPTKEQVPDHLIHHFIRGYFDGDGCLHISDNGRNKIDGSVSIISTMNFCRKMQEKVNNFINIVSLCSHKNQLLEKGNTITSIYTVRGNRNCLTFLNWIYKDAIIYLQRKYDKYIEVKSTVKEIDKIFGERYSNPQYVKNFSKELTDNIIKSYSSGATLKFIAKETGIISKSIKKILVLNNIPLRPINQSKSS